MVDLKNLGGASKGRDQSIELLPPIETVDFDPNGQQPLINASVVNRESVSNGWSFRMQNRDQVLESIRAGHLLFPPGAATFQRFRGSLGSTPA